MIREKRKRENGKRKTPPKMLTFTNCNIYTNTSTLCQFNPTTLAAHGSAHQAATSYDISSHRTSWLHY
jgi:hypothetical protein